MALYDGVIVAGSIRAGRFRKPLVRCVTRYAPQIASRPNAFLPVCLAILQHNKPGVIAHLDGIVARFSEHTGWKPMTTKFVPGALRYTHYNLLTRWMMKRIAASGGGDTDTSRDYVYTDWEDLKLFAVEFGRRLKAAAA
jgi:menaquinone-dependent protoporphyrinogen oxidase